MLNYNCRRPMPLHSSIVVVLLHKISIVLECVRLFVLLCTKPNCTLIRTNMLHEKDCTILLRLLYFLDTGD